MVLLDNLNQVWNGINWLIGLTVTLIIIGTAFYYITELWSRRYS